MGERALENSESGGEELSVEMLTGVKEILPHPTMKRTWSGARKERVRWNERQPQRGMKNEWSYASKGEGRLYSQTKEVNNQGRTKSELVTTTHREFSRIQSEQWQPNEEGNHEAHHSTCRA